MMTASLLTLAGLWIVVLHQYPAYFVPRKSTKPARNQHDLGENWIEVLPTPDHRKVASLQEVR